MRHNTQLSPAGFIFIDGKETAQTLKCCHCGFQWVVVRGSGRVRGWCSMCNSVTCGPKCSGKCVPEEQMLENIEQGRPADFMPVQVNVPRLWKGEEEPKPAKKLIVTGE